MYDKVGQIRFDVQGTEGFEKHMDRLMELSEYMVRRIKQMPDKYYLILEPEMVNVCFWYLPIRVRNMPHTQERIKILGDVRLQTSFENFFSNSIPSYSNYYIAEFYAYFIVISLQFTKYYNGHYFFILIIV